MSHLSRCTALYGFLAGAIAYFFSVLTCFAVTDAAAGRYAPGAPVMRAMGLSLDGFKRMGLTRATALQALMRVFWRFIGQ